MIGTLVLPAPSFRRADQGLCSRCGIDVRRGGNTKAAVLCRDCRAVLGGKEAKRWTCS